MPISVNVSLFLTLWSRQRSAVFDNSVPRRPYCLIFRNTLVQNISDLRPWVFVDWELFSQVLNDKMLIEKQN